MDEAGEDLIERILPRLIALADLRGSQTVIVDRLRALLEISRLSRNGAASNTSSSLTGGNYPVELALSFDRDKVAALTYTVDTFSSGSASRLIETISMAADSIMGHAEQKQLEACVAMLCETPHESIVATYVSVTYTRAAEARFKVHVVGRDGAFHPRLLERLVPAIVNADALGTLARAMDALGAESANFIGFGLTGGRIVSCKGYVGTPYIDLRTVTGLAADMELGLGHAISLVRWYRRFVGKHWGQLGAFGVGLDLRTPRSKGIEVYAYPSQWHIREMRTSLEKQLGDLSPLWSLMATDDKAHAASLYLGGTGVETASSGRLGRTTAYFGVSEKKELQE